MATTKLRTEYTVKQVADACYYCFGNMSAAAEILDIAQTTVSNYKRKYPEIRTAIEKGLAMQVHYDRDAHYKKGLSKYPYRYDAAMQERFAEIKKDKWNYGKENVVSIKRNDGTTRIKYTESTSAGGGTVHIDNREYPAISKDGKTYLENTDQVKKQLRYGRMINGIYGMVMVIFWIVIAMALFPVLDLVIDAAMWLRGLFN